tara:strand:- start:3866 stop:4009 length:144 start_codon:yes stop_codon:yes gene_type:complete
MDYYQQDFMIEIYRDSEKVIEVPDLLVFGLFIGFALFICKLAFKNSK